MRTFITLFLVLLATQVWAQPPSYDYVRKTVEEQNPKDKTPAVERVFVSDNYTSGIIVRFREKITLRELIDQTKRKGTEVGVIVLRSPDNKTRAVFGGSVKPSDTPTLTLKPGDVVFLTNTPMVF